MLLVNFKCYPQVLGRKGFEKAKELERASSETGVKVGIAVVACDLRLYRGLELEVFAQHADPVDMGKHTGSLPLEYLKEAGASGILINHPEKPLGKKEREFLIRKCRRLGLKSVLIGSSREDFLLKEKPSIYSFEVKEFIGSGIAISRVLKDEIRKLATEFSPLFIGGGISKKEDVKIALENGASGILISSTIVKAKNTYKKALELLEGFL